MIKFGTGGWREIIGDGFTKVNVQLLTQGLVNKMKAENAGQNGFIIGYDRRFLSVEAAKWAAEVVAASGVTCYFIRKDAPTPLIMFTVKNYGCRYGMAVTASHNPAVYNGIKVFASGGRDADETVTENLERVIAELSPEDVSAMPYGEGVRAGRIMEINPQNDYIDSIIRGINMDAIRSRSLRVVIDPMYGVSKTSLQTILLTARCDVDVIHERHDALFGGRLPAPSEETLSALITYVREMKADLGIATDGDADRIGVIDDKGQFLHPNRILVLLYYYLLRYKGWRGPAIRNIATTHLLDKVAESFGEKCYEVPVGFKHVSAKMVQTNAVIGGESSGGLTVRGHIQGKDGIYAAALLVEMIAVTGRGLSDMYGEITSQFGQTFMAERDYRFTEAKKVEILQKLIHDKALPVFDGACIADVSYLDGCKIYFKDGGWIICRFSGTEPLLRVFCEMPDEAAANATCDVMKDFLAI